jgi:CRP-like cAMP-binding protein
VEDSLVRENLLLATLRNDTYARLKAEIVPLHLAETLYDPDDQVAHVYFPGRNTMVSLIAETAEGESAEVGVTGSEGVVPTAPILGADTTPHKLFVQISGIAYRVAADDLREECAANEQFRMALLRYTQALFVQISATALCNRLHEVEQRLARWLLISQDRTQNQEIPLTHEFLAKMLGVNRASVSLNAELLKKAGIIDYRRGKIRIVDRRALESVSCACYAEVKTRYQRLGF